MVSMNSAKCLIVNIEEVSRNSLKKISANLNELIQCHSPGKIEVSFFSAGIANWFV